MDRLPHYIKENKTVSVPKRIILFDTETTPKTLKDGRIEQHFKLASAVHQRIRNIDKPPVVSWLETYNANQLCEWILNKTVQKQRLYVISANIWFDIRVSGMLHHLHKQGWSLHRMFINGLVLIIIFKLGAKTLVFLNFQNFFRVSVAVMGKCIGLSKLEVKFDEVSKEDLMAYCRRDTEIIWRVMNNLFQFIKKKELGNFGFTFPAIAFNIYRHKFMNSKLLVHNNSIVTKLERASYFGGRVDCHEIGEFKDVNLIQIDINSMYPYVMRNYESPCVLKFYCKDPPIQSINNFLRGYCVTCYAHIETDEPVYPVRLKGKCVCPIGKFDTYLSTGSLKYALKHGHIKHIYEAAIYTKDYIFTEYIDFFYNLRLKYSAAGNLPYVSLCKNLLNSLYGKFGQRGDEIVERSDCDYSIMRREHYYDATAQKHYVTTKFFGNSITVEKKVNEGANSIVSIAAHITDYARMYLWRFMKQIGLENLYYNDTDCIIFDQDKYDISKLPINAHKLGHFKVEKEATCIKLFGLKDYVFDGVTKIKGVSSKAKKIGHNEYEQLFFPGICTELHEDLTKPYTIRPITKKLKRVYTKGVVTNSGKVKPITLG